MKKITLPRRLQRLALYLFFFSINFEVLDPLHSDQMFSVAKIAGYLYILTIIPELPYFLRLDGVGAIMLPISIFYSLLTLVGIVNINYISSSFFEFSILQNMILLLLLLNHERRDHGILDKAIVSFAFGAVTMSALFMLGIGISNDFGRFTMFGQNENILAVQMSTSIFILLIILIQQNIFHLGRVRYWFLAAIPVMIDVLIRTASRVGFVAFAVSCVVVILFSKQISRKYKVALVVFIVIPVSFMLFYSSQMLIFNRLMDTVRNGDMGGRKGIWESVLSIVMVNPLFGVGLTGYAEKSNAVFGWWQSPHNVFLEVLCYTGITGLIAYLAFLFQLAKRSYSAYMDYGLILPMLLLIPVGGLLLTGQMLDVKMGWCIFAYIAAVPGLHLHKKLRTRGHGAARIAMNPGQKTLPDHSRARLLGRRSQLRARPS